MRRHLYVAHLAIEHQYTKVSGVEVAINFIKASDVSEKDSKSQLSQLQLPAVLNLTIEKFPTTNKSSLCLPTQTQLYSLELNSSSVHGSRRRYEQCIQMR